MGKSMLYEIRYEDILVIDKNLNVLSNSAENQSVETELHITLLNALEDYNASIHVHPYYSNVFAYNSMEIPINSNVMEYYVGKTKVVRAAKGGSKELCQGCFEKMLEIKDERKGRPINLLLDRHGVITIAKNLEEAFAAINAIEQAAMYELFSKLIRV
jgi:ribulose-5-phosphate 4-epimerase/fuculose-1-phosphate aldolase